ncbi:zinc metallopeptidase [candidate division LCP-89 bacterium B3_LCP]|uniref:Zinc metallopeptidase n=1 Tax=candidate division LCP-89 bacterium B3_LCP TaxID=2012998 RepID=A0A532V3S4_UNCL8|nr:MAG: zinc metallopeptidase [candidate division LCP-89 bacterium B3_LCP]
MFFFDPTFILLIPALILAFYAQSKVKSTFAKFSKVRASRSNTGKDVARALLDMRGLGDIPVELTKGRLSDHYDPRKKILRLSEPVYGSDSVAALGIAAHETGHALQHADNYGPLMLRSSIVPVANFGSFLAFPLFFIGFLFSNSVPWLMDVGIIFFSGAVAFSLITLPVEFNASSRALTLLREGGYLTDTELPHAKAVLNAAAWTYVAAATMAITHLVRLLILRGMRD